jgi:hypothetical protein
MSVCRHLLRMAIGTYGGWLIAKAAACGTLYAETTIGNFRLRLYPSLTSSEKTG